MDRQADRQDVRENSNRMDMQLQTQNGSWELVLSCCVSGRLLWSLSLQPAGCPATTWHSAGEVNKSLEHTQSSLQFAWQSQDCPLVTPILSTAKQPTLLFLLRWRHLFDWFYTQKKNTTSYLKATCQSQLLKQWDFQGTNRKRRIFSVILHETVYACSGSAQP